MCKVAFIPCSKTKAKAPCAASKLYQGAFFRKALRYCLQEYDEVWILSAEYGLVGLGDHLEPYEKTLIGAGKKVLKEWAGMVLGQMEKEGLIGKEWIFFTPEAYCKHFEGERPLDGLSIGKRLQWINKKLQKNTGFGL